MTDDLDSLVVGRIDTGFATKDGWIPDGSGHTVRLRHLSPEAQALLRAALDFDADGYDCGEQELCTAARAFAASVKQ